MIPELNRQLNKKGLSMISVLIGTLIVFISYWAYLASENYTNRNQAMFREKYIAKLFALELIEYFRGYNSSGVLAAALPATSICNKVNFLNRTTGAMVSANAIASLPPSYLDNSINNGSPNRYFQMDVVDVTTLAPNAAYCGQTAGTLNLPDNERILVTVGMNWIPHGKGLSDATSLEVTSLIPGK